MQHCVPAGWHKSVQFHVSRHPEFFNLPRTLCECWGLFDGLLGWGCLSIPFHDFQKITLSVYKHRLARLLHRTSMLTPNTFLLDRQAMSHEDIQQWDGDV